MPDKGLEVLWTWTPRIHVTPLSRGEAESILGLDVTAQVQPLALYGRFRLEPELIQTLRPVPNTRAWEAVNHEADFLRADLLRELDELTSLDRFRAWSRMAVALGISHV